MENNIRLSIIVPVYNVAAYIRDCLDSLLYEIASDTEIIVVDDGSTDESPQICDEYAERNQHVQVIHQKNAGQSAARNAGLSAAKGTYLAFVDSDDFVSMPALNTVVARMDEMHVDWAIADYTPVDSLTKFQKDNIQTTCNGSGIVYGISDYLVNINTHTMMVWNKVYRRDKVKDIQYPVGAIYEDVYYIRHLIECTAKILYVPICIYYYRVQRKGSTAFSFKKNRLLGYLFFDDIADFVRKNYGNREYDCVATYAADFFQGQYYECAILLGDKEIMQYILDKYKKYIKGIPFSLFPLYRSFFRLSPSIYTHMKSLRNK